MAKPKSIKPVCILCGWKTKKQAKILPSNLKYAYAGASFCSMKCAVNWALLEIQERIINQGLHCCSSTGEWHNYSMEECTTCEPLKPEEVDVT